MAKAKIVFHKCNQNSQELGSNDEHMISRVFFTLIVDGKIYDALYADLKQTIGSEYKEGDIEVYISKDYKGPINYQIFRDDIINYYMSLVGENGRVINVKNSHVIMKDNVFVKERIVTFDIDPQVSSW